MKRARAEDLSAPQILSELSALAQGKPQAFFRQVVVLAGDPSLPVNSRIACVQLAAKSREVSKKDAQDLLLGLLQGEKTPSDLRLVSAIELGQHRLAGPRVWKVLHALVLDPKLTKGPVQGWVLQHHSLEGLRYAPRALLEKLLLDPRVYRHPYYPLRVDAALGYASLDMKSKAIFDILCSLLVDPDKSDPQHLVRISAWTALWSLTGVVAGEPSQPELFRHAPRLKTTAVQDRMFDILPRLGMGRLRTIVEMASDLDRMKGARAEFESHWSEVAARWAEEKKAQEGGAKEPSGKPEKGSGAAGGKR